VVLACEHEKRHDQAARDGHDHVDPPQAICNPIPSLAGAESDDPIDDRCKPHRNRAQKHQQDRILEDATRFIEGSRPTGAVQPGETSEQHDVQKPKAPGNIVEARNRKWELIERQRDGARTHRHAEPVRRESTGEIGQKSPASASLWHPRV
jgi:hypothetical protein